MGIFGRRRHHEAVEAAGAAEPTRQQTDRAQIDTTVAALLHESTVGEAVARAPRTWRSCVAFDYSDGSDPFGFRDECVELMEHVWLSSYLNHLNEATFEIGLGDELGAYIDLQADPDPVTEFLKAHPDIDASTVEHDNSERYTFTPIRELDESAFAVIAVDALAAGHVATLRAAGLT